MIRFILVFFGLLALQVSKAQIQLLEESSLSEVLQVINGSEKTIVCEDLILSGSSVFFSGKIHKIKAYEQREGELSVLIYCENVSIWVLFLNREVCLAAIIDYEGEKVRKYMNQNKTTNKN